MARQEVTLVSRTTRFIYSVFAVSFIRIVFFIAAFLNNKARRGMLGRKSLFENLRRDLSSVPEGRRIWFHASSLGEFEQAKPVIEMLKGAGYHIIASFFSPSGYEYSRSYRFADVITYIPLDTVKNARRFASIVKPEVVVVMRYDMWLNHLIAAKESGAKVILADATFPVKLIHHAKFLKDFFRELYGLADEIFVTNPEQKRMFDFFLRRESSVVVGDTRFDRVYDKSVTNDVPRKIPVGLNRTKRTVLILGSTWSHDMEVLSPSLSRLAVHFPKLTTIIVPHEPGKEEVADLLAKFPSAKIMSELDGADDAELPFVIVDQVGLLMQLYVLADIAYVGGGFGSGVHSVLEPAVYGIPIITGPRIERSDEALQLNRNGALFFVKDRVEAYRVLLRMVANVSVRENAGRIAKNFVTSNLGASATVAERVKKICGDTHRSSAVNQ